MLQLRCGGVHQSAKQHYIHHRYLDLLPKTSKPSTRRRWSASFLAIEVVVTENMSVQMAATLMTIIQ